MGKLNRTCFTCGKRYSYCPSCESDKDKPSWYGLFHDLSCKDVFNAINDFYYKHKSLKEVIDILEQYHAKDKLEKYIENIRKQVLNIYQLYETQQSKDTPIKIKKENKFDNQQIIKKEE